MTLRSGPRHSLLLVMCTVTLVATCCVVALAQAPAEGSDFKSDNVGYLTSQVVLDNNDNNTTTAAHADSHQLTAEQQTNNLAFIFSPIFFFFRTVYKIIAAVYTVVYYILNPIFYILSFFYQIFLIAPYMFIKNLVTTFYPLYIFCAVAAIFGFCVGGTAGWFSEVIAGVLTAPVDDDTALAEQESQRRVAKLRRRAAALANLRARNGGRVPEEFYGRFTNARP